MGISLKPHAALVTALAAGHVEGLRAAVRGRPDWHEVGELAARHRVDALCWWMWTKLADQRDDFRGVELPPALRERLRRGYIHHQLRNESLARDLASLQDSLLAHGVEGLFLKGPWMAWHAYPEPGTRAVADIDLCVREEQYPDALAALGAAGWSSPGPLPRSPAEALARSHYRQQIRFSARGKRGVELHFRLVNLGPPADERWVWESAREVRVPLALRVPGAEAMLLHLLLHANQHGFASLRLLHDIRWALGRDRSELDSTTFLHRVRELRCGASCYHALQLAAELAGAAVPSSLLSALAPSMPRRVFFTLAWRLRAVRRLEASRRRVVAEAPLFYLLEMGGLGEKARFLARVIAEAAKPGGLPASGRQCRPPSVPPRGRPTSSGPAPAPEAVSAPARPRRRAHLKIRELEGDLAVHDPDADRTLLLNATAAAVLDLCDGHRTAGEIAGEIAVAFSVGNQDLLADVKDVLEELVVQGLVESA